MINYATLFLSWMPFPHYFFRESCCFCSIFLETTSYNLSKGVLNLFFFWIWFFFLFDISFFIFLTLVVATMPGTSKKWHQQIIKLGQQQPTNMFATKLYYTSTIPTYVHIRLIYTPHTHTHLIIAIDTLQTQTLIYVVSVWLLSSDFEGSKLVKFLAKN